MMNSLQVLLCLQAWAGPSFKEIPASDPAGRVRGDAGGGSQRERHKTPDEKLAIVRAKLYHDFADPSREAFDEQMRANGLPAVAL